MSLVCLKLRVFKLHVLRVLLFITYLFGFNTHADLSDCSNGLSFIDVTSACFGAHGDGVNDDTGPINRALNAIKDGGIVFIPKGTYYINKPEGLSLNNKSNVIIKSNNAVLKSANIKFKDVEHLTPLLHINECINCVIENVIFDGTYTKDYDVSALLIEDSKNNHVKNNEAFGFSGNAAYGEVNCENNLWSGNIARDSRVSSKSRGFWLGNGQIEQFTKGVQVHNNIAINNAATGIVLYSDGSEALNNISSFNKGSGLIHGGAVGFQVKNSIVKNNILEGNLYYGYQNDSYAGFGEFVLTNIIVKENTILSNLAGGILLYDSTEQTVSGNLIKNNFGPGIVLEKNLKAIKIINNNIANDGEKMVQVDGIQANPHHSNQDGVLIFQNIIRSPKIYGIELQAVTLDSELDNFTIKANKIFGSQFGLYAANNGKIDNLKVVGNKFFSTGVLDIKISGSKNINDIIIKNNVLSKGDSSLDESWPN